MPKLTNLLQRSVSARAGYVLRRINGSALVEMIAPVGIR